MPTVTPTASFALALVAVVLGLALILAPNRLARLQRKLILWQLKLMRQGRYQKVAKLYGWLLFVLGVALLLVQWLMIASGQM